MERFRGQTHPSTYRYRGPHVVIHKVSVVQLFQLELPTLVGRLSTPRKLFLMVYFTLKWKDRHPRPPVSMLQLFSGCTKTGRMTKHNQEMNFIGRVIDVF